MATNPTTMSSRTDPAAWAEGLLDGLNAAQRQAAEAVRGPVVILAGAGTGKTRTITHRIANQVAAGVAIPGQILAVTFTDRAAGELRHRLGQLGMPGTVRAATFHAAAWAQVRHFWPRIDDRPLPQVLASKLRLLIPTAQRLRVQASDLAGEIEWAKARRVRPEGYAAAAVGRDAPLPLPQMAEVYASYEDAKARQDLIDFDDMLAIATAAITDHPDVAEEFRDRYRFFTVDEFQDVNPAQHALLAAWLGERDELCVVGDDDQTIYRFTGASPDYLTGFRRAYPGARRVTLTQSYRSSPEVLALANRVLWTKPAELRKRLEPTCPPGPAPVFAECDDDQDERIAVVAEIRSLLAAGVRAGEIAVCYRMNAQSADWEQALADAGIAYVVRGEGGFFARTEILQALRALRDAGDHGSASLDPGRDRDPGRDDGAVPARPARADRQVERVLRDAMSWHPRREPQGTAARERWQNLGVLLELAERLTAEQPELTYRDLVVDLLGRAAAGHDTPDEGGAVTLSTLHRAKGLEFDAVFVVGCEEGLLPISHAGEDEQAVEDERRLFYVGVTRARLHLHLSWACARAGRSGRQSRRRPSRFLYGLGDGAPVKATGGAAAGKRGEGRLPFAKEDAGEPALTAEQERTAERLREWRRERAQRDGMPAYVVFDNRTMRGLARAAPSTPEDLMAVRGFGPAKLEQFGDELLQLIRAES